MKYPLIGKLMALAAVVATLAMALGAVDGVSVERQRRQMEAQQSVADSLAASQTLLGPLLRRQCTESWSRIDGEGKAAKQVDEHRDFTQLLWPRKLQVRTRATVEPRYRGVFKVNGYLSRSTLTADWSTTALPVVASNGDRSKAQIRCEAATVAVALGDARGVRSAVILVDGKSMAVMPGSGMPASAHGLHAVVQDRESPDAPMHVEITLALAGTGSLAWAPVGDESTVQAESDWAHPSFAGHFLPISREVSAKGFEAQWQVSALATTAQQAVRSGGGICELNDSGAVQQASAAANAKSPCVDTFGVLFIDPVNSQVLSERAIKYGLLFVVLTFVCVALVEVMRQLRVHPVQYLLVGCALTVFFLLLLSLGEHVSFGIAYFCASAACTALLTFYGCHLLRGVRHGLAFGATIAGLYGALFALLQLEQTALVLGSILLFAVIAAVMVATRRVDWYALAQQLQQAPASEEAGAVEGAPA